jgi:hypothetical protein
MRPAELGGFGGFGGFQHPTPREVSGRHFLTTYASDDVF